jgi:hypothetical protein
MLAHDRPQQRALALRQAGPDRAAEQPAQHAVRVERLEEHLGRSVESGQRRAAREVGGLLGRDSARGALAPETAGTEGEDREQDAGSRACPRRPDQCPVAVSVEPGRA